MLEHGTLLRAVTPVRMMWEFSTWMTRWPSLTRYAPIPMARHVTWAQTRGHTELRGGSGCSNAAVSSAGVCTGGMRQVACYTLLSPPGDLKTKENWGGVEQGKA